MSIYDDTTREYKHSDNPDYKHAQDPVLLSEKQKQLNDLRGKLSGTQPKSIRITDQLNDTLNAQYELLEALEMRLEPLMIRQDESDVTQPGENYPEQKHSDQYFQLARANNRASRHNDILKRLISQIDTEI